MNWALFTITVSLSALSIPLFGAAGKAAKPELVRKLGLWLSNEYAETQPKYYFASFMTFFDDLFGHKMLSSKRIFRSTVISLILVTIFILLQELLKLFVDDGFFQRGGIIEDTPIHFIFFYIFIFNLIGDFVSLQETRWLLGVLIRARFQWAIPITIADFILTFCLFWLPYILISGEFDVFFELRTYQDLWPLMTSAFLTSIWLYIYLIGSFIIKITNTVRRGNAFLLSLFDVRRKPFITLGIISCLYVFVLGTIISLIF